MWLVVNLDALLLGKSTHKLRQVLVSPQGHGLAVMSAIPQFYLGKEVSQRSLKHRVEARTPVTPSPTCLLGIDFNKTGTSRISTQAKLGSLCYGNPSHQVYPSTGGGVFSPFARSRNPPTGEKVLFFYLCRTSVKLLTRPPQCCPGPLKLQVKLPLKQYNSVVERWTSVNKAVDVESTVLVLTDKH